MKEIVKTNAILTGFTFDDNENGTSAVLSAATFLNGHPRINIPLTEESFRSLKDDIYGYLTKNTEVEIIVRVIN